MTCHFGCEVERLIARGLCHRCYQRLLWRKKNNPDTWGGWPTQRVRKAAPHCMWCLEPHYAKGLCRNHYRRVRRRFPVTA